MTKINAQISITGKAQVLKIDKYVWLCCGKKYEPTKSPIIITGITVVFGISDFRISRK